MLAPVRIMTEAQYKLYIDDFGRHFMMHSSAFLIPIRSVKKVYPWQGLKDMVTGMNTPVHGIRFTYGLNGSDLILVIEMIQDTAGVLSVIANSARVYDEMRDVFNAVDQTQMSTWALAYMNNVKVVRNDGEPFTSLGAAGTYPDPGSVWFPWDDTIRYLFGEFPLIENRYLVVTCMSAEYDLSPYPSEYRHGLGLNVAKLTQVGGQNLLVDDFDLINHAGRPAQGKAMDLGNLHPPKKP